MAHKKVVKKTAKKVKKLTLKQKKARNKIDPQTGLVLSRRQYEKKYPRARLSPHRARIQRGNLGRYYAIVRDYQDHINAKRKKRKQRALKTREIMQSVELKKILIDLKRGLIIKERGDTEAGNKLLRGALKKIGRRDGVPDHVPVGESNAERSG